MERKLQTDEEEEEVTEIIHFKIDLSKCDSTSATVIQRRSVTHKRQGENPWVESFEDTFTVPLHQFNLNQLIPKKDTEDIEETVIIEQKIIKETRVSKGTKLQEFEIDNDEHKRAVLEAIDHKVLLNLELIEKRKNIVKKRTIRNKSEKSQPSLGDLSLGPKGSDSILEPVPQQPVLPTLLPKKKILKDEKSTQQKQEEGPLF